MADNVTAVQQQTFSMSWGTWILKHLRYGDSLRMAGLATRYLDCRFDDAPLSFQTEALIRATIELATVQAPPGWDWDTQEDDAKLTELYRAYREWDNSFRAGVADTAGQPRPSA